MLTTLYYRSRILLPLLTSLVCVCFLSTPVRAAEPTVIRTPDGTKTYTLGTDGHYYQVSSPIVSPSLQPVSERRHLLRSRRHRLQSVPLSQGSCTQSSPSSQFQILPTNAVGSCTNGNCPLSSPNRTGLFRR